MPLFVFPEPEEPEEKLAFLGGIPIAGIPCILVVSLEFLPITEGGGPAAGRGAVMSMYSIEKLAVVLGLKRGAPHFVCIW